MSASFSYYPVSPAQQNWGLYITCAGHHTTRAGEPFPSPKHPDEYYFTWEIGRILHEWQLCLIEKGQGEIEFRHAHHKISAGTLIILPPGCWHRYRPDSTTGWTTYWIGFNGEIANHLMKNALLQKDGEIQFFDTNGFVMQTFASIVTGLLSTTKYTPFSASVGIPTLIAAVLEESIKNNSGTITPPILKAQMYIDEHVSKIVDFMTLAESLGLSYRSFRYLFAKETGLSPLQYQLNRRLIRAKNLLSSSDMPVKEIAESIGFSTTWYFSHFFQKKVGQSPARYRKNNRPITTTH